MLMMLTCPSRTSLPINGVRVVYLNIFLCFLYVLTKFITAQVLHDCPWYLEMREILAQRPNVTQTGLGNSTSSFDQDILQPRRASSVSDGFLSDGNPLTPSDGYEGLLDDALSREIAGSGGEEGEGQTSDTENVSGDLFPSFR